MMERLRNRDLRTNNKCYSMYFDDDQNKDITNSGKASSMPLKKIKAKSPRKREPVKSVAKPASASLSDDSNPATATIDVAPLLRCDRDGSTSNAPLDNDSVLDFTVTKCVAKSMDCDGNKCDDTSANADKNSVGPYHEKEAATKELDGETMSTPSTSAQNERKRRLSICHEDDDDGEDGEDGGDIGVNDANCSTFAPSSSTGNTNNKKLKMEFSREQMFQVRSLKSSINSICT